MTTAKAIVVTMRRKIPSDITGGGLDGGTGSTSRVMFRRHLFLCLPARAECRAASLREARRQIAVGARTRCPRCTISYVEPGAKAADRSRQAGGSPRRYRKDFIFLELNQGLGGHSRIWALFGRASPKWSTSSLARNGPTPDITPSRGRCGRSSRQPGQIRKEAAVTNSLRVMPVSHLFLAHAVARHGPPGRDDRRA
jgi:hypothetical protein